MTNTRKAPSKRRRTHLSTASKAKAPFVLTRRVPATLKKIAFGSGRSVSRSLAGMRMASLDIAPLLDEALWQSPAKASQLAFGIAGKSKSIADEQASLRVMMRWASVATSDAGVRQRIIVRAFKSAGREMCAIHGIAQRGAWL